MNNVRKRTEKIDREFKKKQPGKKQCRKCGSEFPIENFPERLSRGIKSRRTICMDCHKEYSKIYQHKKKYEERQVYIIQEGEERGGPLKIGSTTSAARFCVLQGGNFRTLKLLLQFPGTYEDEYNLHKKFKSARIYREVGKSKIATEWFRCTPDLQSFIAKKKKALKCQ